VTSLQLSWACERGRPLRKLKVRRRRRAGRRWLAASALRRGRSRVYAFATIPGQTLRPHTQRSRFGQRRESLLPCRLAPTMEQPRPYNCWFKARVLLPGLSCSGRLTWWAPPGPKLRATYTSRTWPVYWVSDPLVRADCTILYGGVAWNPRSGFRLSKTPRAARSGGPSADSFVFLAMNFGLTVAGGSQNVKVPNVLGLGETRPFSR